MCILQVFSESVSSIHIPWCAYVPAGAVYLSEHLYLL
jgi:hypothetical protein